MYMHEYVFVCALQYTLCILHNVCICIYIYIYMSVYTRVCMHIYIHACAHHLTKLAYLSFEELRDGESIRAIVHHMR